MITDPKSTVSGVGPQCAVAVAVAGAECVLRLMGNVHAPYFALFLVGPVANLIEIGLKSRRATPPALPGPWRRLRMRSRHPPGSACRAWKRWGDRPKWALNWAEKVNGSL